MTSRNRNAERQRLEKKYGSYYKPHFLNDLGLCLYCGQKKQHIDHCPPLSSVGAFGSEYFAEKGIPFVLISSCADCNNKLGNKHYFTLRQRKGFIAAVLREKFAAELARPMWESDEIGELGRGLRDYVNDRQGFRLVLERRLDYATSD